MTPTAPILALLILAGSVGQTPPPRTPAAPPAQKPVAVEKIGPNQIRLGTIVVDTAKRELSVPGKANNAKTLEFVASTQGGYKAYESALSLNTDAVTFNTALLLLGLDPSRARVPSRHFDPVPPAGDPVEMFVEWGVGPQKRRVRVEQLLFDKRINATMPEGPWVYTGSTFVGENKYLADVDGVLIGFVHSPAPIIENPRAGAVDAFQSVVFNPSLALLPGMPVTLIVHALERTSKDSK